MHACTLYVVPPRVLKSLTGFRTREKRRIMYMHRVVRINNLSAGSFIVYTYIMLFKRIFFFFRFFIPFYIVIYVEHTHTHTMRTIYTSVHNEAAMGERKI